MSLNKLTEEQIKHCKGVFEDILDQADMEKERNFLTYDELETALTKCTGQSFRHKNVFYKLLSEIETEEPNQITFLDFLDIYFNLVGKSDDGETDADTFDAFVALGGSEDENSYINSELLIDTIKNQFKMTIDIEKLIKEVDDDDSGQIEFGEFKELLQSKEKNDELDKFSKWFQF